VFQTYYENALLAQESPSSISWIGSTQAFLILFVSIFSGPAYDAGHFRLLICIGGFLIPFGFMMTSLCHHYWQVFLAQGICIGIGNGCLFVPSVAILPQYFTTHKALANGIAVSGSSIGGIIMPVVLRQLYPKIGFPWAVRVLGFLSLTTCLFSIIVMRPRIIPKHKRHLTDIGAFTEPPYLVLCVALFFCFIAFYVPLYYVGIWAIRNQITDVNFAFYLLPIMNAASVVGRILPTAIADVGGVFNTLFSATLISGILSLSWIAVKSKPGIIVFAVLYGISSGAFVSLPAVAVHSLTTDMRKLVGTPVCGTILNDTGKFLGLQLFSGFTLLFTSLLVLVIRTVRVGWKLKVKV